MILYEPYKAEHMDNLVLQPAQEHLRDILDYDAFKVLETDDAYTFTVDGEPIACCGLIRMWPGRALMWCFLTEMSVRNKLGLTRLIKDYMDYIDIQRLEITVDAGFDGAHRWAKILGFTLEAPLMKSYGVNGSDHSLYAKVKE